MKKIITTNLILLAIPLFLLAQSYPGLPNLSPYPELQEPLNQLDSQDQGAIPPEQADISEAQQLRDLVGALQKSSVTGQTGSGGNDFQLDLIWRAYTLTPYDYPGKALPSASSIITVYALAKVPNPERLTYTWIINDISSSRDGPEKIGRGEDTFNFISYNIPGFTHEIRVIAQDEANNKSTSAGLEIRTRRPEVYLYESQNENYNTLTATPLIFLPDEEKSIMTRLFYFNVKSLNDLDFKWYLGNSPAESGSARPEILPIHISPRAIIGATKSLRLEISPRGLKNNINQQVVVRKNIIVSRQ